MEKKKASPRIMELINPHLGILQCPACGHTHAGMTKNGKFARGTWQCVNGCTIDDVRQTRDSE